MSLTGQHGGSGTPSSTTERPRSQVQKDSSWQNTTKICELITVVLVRNLQKIKTV